MEILISEGLSHPEDGFGLQQAVLEEVGARQRGATALMWTSSRYVAATRLETRLPGFDGAVRRAKSLGFPVLVRNSGGGAVVANEGSISFSITAPVEDLRHGLFERYDEGAALVVSALQRSGVEAETGEVEGEFCPGAYSVRVGGSSGIKVAGLAQRVTRRAARIEALILISETKSLVPVLQKFHAALGLPFRPDSVGDLPTSVPRVMNALCSEVEVRYGASKSRIGESTFERARRLRETWSPQP